MRLFKNLKARILESIITWSEMGKKLPKLKGSIDPLYICNICKINAVLPKFLSHFIKNAPTGLQWQHLYEKMIAFSFFFFLSMTAERQELKLSKFLLLIS